MVPEEEFLEPITSLKALYRKGTVTQRGVIVKGGVVTGDVAEIGVSILDKTSVSLAIGDVSSMSEEDIGTETLGGVPGIYSSEGSQMGFQ